MFNRKIWRKSKDIFYILWFFPKIMAFTWSDNKVRELIAVKVLHTSLLNTTAVAFKLLPFGSYAPMPAPSPPFKTNLELFLWNGLQSCRCINPDVINVIKMPSSQNFPVSRRFSRTIWRIFAMFPSVLLVVVRPDLSSSVTLSLPS